jgi:HAAS
VTKEEYLAELRRHLKVGPLTKRRIVRELESHIDDATGQGEAEQRAIADLGPPAVVAASFQRPRARVGWTALAAVALMAVTALLVVKAAGGTQRGARAAASPSPDWCGEGWDCTLIYDSVTVRPETPCLQRYLSFPEHLSRSMIQRAKAIRIEGETLTFDYGRVELVVPCNGYESFTPQRVQSYLVHNPIHGTTRIETIIHRGPYTVEPGEEIASASVS